MNPSRPDEARVLVIYTGGTIGMLLSPNGYVPEPFFLTETLRRQKRFHDPLEDSLFSNATSVEGYREWSNSGTSTPVTPESLLSLNTSVTQHPTLVVRSSRPIGKGQTLFVGPNSPLADMQGCEKISDGVYQARLPSLVTPRSTVSGKDSSKRIRYAILEWIPLLDSSNIEMNDWIRIATEIELNYTGFDAFVILHGTDTMSYTSSALSFLLEDLGKTVILTGAQIPLSQLRNDAVDNLLGALSIAGNYIIPECSLYFNHTLYRGNRVSKASSFDLNAFHSPNFPPLVNVGIEILVNWNNVLRQTRLRRFRVHKEMSPHVATLRLFPGMTGTTARAFLSPPARGVVLETFGAGNVPQRTDLLQALQEACDAGVVIVAISQCYRGSVSSAYETGRALQRVGVVPGGDMTPECALTKLSYLLSKSELSTSQVRELISTPLRGELTRQTLSVPSNPADLPNLHSIQGLLVHLVRLMSPNSQIPLITVSPDIEGVAQDATASSSKTAAETAFTEAALLRSLVHLAAARNDLECLELCLDASANWEMEDRTPTAILDGPVNCLEPGSNRSPLHIAALNGSTASVSRLLKAGALVHLRDNLGHTALYYAARQGHADIVDLLVSAGANLGGFECDAGYASLALKSALDSGDHKSISIWKNAGMNVERPETENGT
ncbi:asparaginase-domain-containing protein [Pisolithus marmoratus]|nr:asparaginase-domain-containing protein [Pisolithus marmoratus]